MEVDRLSEAASRVGNAAGDSAMAPMAATIHGSVDSVRDLESARAESGESAVQQHPTTAGWNRRVRVGANPMVS